MPLIVGDTSYISTEQADDYHDMHGNPAWATATPEARESALIQSTAWLDSVARGKWKGTRATQEQLLAWPRVGVEDEDGFKIANDLIPSVVECSVAEAALRVVSGTILSPDLDRGGKVKSTSVGNGAVSITYMDDAPAETNFSTIENLLSGVLKGKLFGAGGNVISSIPMIMS